MEASLLGTLVFPLPSTGPHSWFPLPFSSCKACISLGTSTCHMILISISLVNLLLCRLFSYETSQAWSPFLCDKYLLICVFRCLGQVVLNVMNTTDTTWMNDNLNHSYLLLLTSWWWFLLPSFIFFFFPLSISPAVSFWDLNFMWRLLSVPPLTSCFISQPRWDVWQVTFP